MWVSIRLSGQIVDTRGGGRALLEDSGDQGGPLLPLPCKMTSSKRRPLKAAIRFMFLTSPFYLATGSATVHSQTVDTKGEYLLQYSCVLKSFGMKTQQPCVAMVSIPGVGTLCHFGGRCIYRTYTIAFVTH